MDRLIAFALAAAVSAACSEREPSEMTPDQPATGTPGMQGGSGGVTPPAGGGAAPAAMAGSSGGSTPLAGMNAAMTGGSAAPPTAGSSGSAGMSEAGAQGAGAGGTMETAGAGGTTSEQGCTRDLLKATVDTYFSALAAHDPEMLPLAETVKFTENGETLALGEGLWANAGMVKFRETLLDTETCGTVTQSVVPDGSTDIPLALRLAVEGGKITEIETIAVRSGDYLVASNTRNMIALEPWGATVPEGERQTREELVGWIDKYFRMFPMGGCNLSSDCDRMENGFTLACDVGATCSNADPSGSAVMTPRVILADVEAGMAAGFTMFQGRYTDVHMIKYAGGEVLGVHTILGEADGSGWN